MTTPEPRPAERLTGRCEGCEGGPECPNCEVLAHVREAAQERQEEVAVDDVGQAR